jgi:hypothetical protein
VFCLSNYKYHFPNHFGQDRVTLRLLPSYFLGCSTFAKMPFDPEDLQGLEEYQQSRMRKEYEPSAREKIRSITVICLILNRGIGSGIFATPSKILQGTRSVGVSLIFWGVGGILVTLGVLVWLTFGLSTPKQNIGGQTRGVPRSGGEKNYVCSPSLLPIL